MPLTIEKNYTIPSHEGRVITAADRAPFNWETWSLLARDGRDSIVGTLETESGRRYVVKWNKRNIPVEDLSASAKYIKKSVELYRATLGDDYIVPTSLAVGEKSEGSTRYKLYTVQPYVEGWTARELPDNLHTNPEILQKWYVLYGRIAHLYQVANEVNRQVHSTGSGEIYPIALRIGQLWGYISQGLSYPPLPKSPNILISKANHDIKLCDFGTTTSWGDEMEIAYTQIIERVSNSRTNIS